MIIMQTDVNSLRPSDLTPHFENPRRRKAIDCIKYRYIDKVHVDIGFGDTIVVGGTRYYLVFVY